ncbi:hypothetical protein GCM10007897_22430 [Sphingobium jiangsuense]|uniref:Uncharacterized protein n=1 Tax=Sphingobium jiangsuense TaxID=870476 RepID=A0A7W6FNK9_9SPHN|nr:hypothetical protein [Sphingobium jiangsuense]MBB3924855.1 hypothetical protein [Sphingobium jiangsuense]GLT00853.1 hypothetical protein GCM10007897_22430 [Sphingobium jiangsuense]
MPSPALLQAINRLDQAISRAEAAFQEARSRARRNADRRDALITEAMTEIDELMSALRENGDG